MKELLVDMTATMRSHSDTLNKVAKLLDMDKQPALSNKLKDTANILVDCMTEIEQFLKTIE